MASVAITRVSDDTKTVAESPSRRCPVCGASYPGEFVVCPKDATVLETGSSDDDPLIGEVLAGSFRVTKLLSSGGMGRVYEAEHVRLPRRFAVKVMHEALSKHREVMERFEREAQAAASITSEHVVEMVDVVRTRDGMPCLVSELLEGEDLSTVCERIGKVPLSRAITICRQICRGLAAAHEAGVVHRDLKPSNVFLVRRSDDRIHIKILDFGVAKLTDGKDLTRTGSVVGTPAYMAPEQALGSSNVDDRADVYGVGALLYKLLTGSAPFTDQDPVSTLRRVVAEDPKRPRDLDRTIPEAIELLIQRAMARSPADRPASARELECELAEHDESARTRPTRQEENAAPAGVDVNSAPLVPSLPPPPSAERARRAKGARPAALGLALAASLAVGAAIFVIAGSIVLLIAGRSALTSTEKILLAVISGLFVLIASVFAMRALIARWRSAWAMDRLAGGMRVALLTLLSMEGVLAIGWHTYRLAAPFVVGRWLPLVDIGVIAAPTLVSVAVFVATIRRAESHS
jgi:tRNA A-37 threonylcarbamoyl transferase component Bud32